MADNDVEYDPAGVPAMEEPIDGEVVTAGIDGPTGGGEDVPPEGEGEGSNPDQVLVPDDNVDRDNGAPTERVIREGDPNLSEADKQAIADIKGRLGGFEGDSNAKKIEYDPTEVRDNEDEGSKIPETRIIREGDPNLSEADKEAIAAIKGRLGDFRADSNSDVKPSREIREGDPNLSEADKQAIASIKGRLGGFEGDSNAKKIEYDPTEVRDNEDEGSKIQETRTIREGDPNLSEDDKRAIADLKGRVGDFRADSNSDAAPTRVIREGDPNLSEADKQAIASIRGRLG